jgi:hypothetical protein
MKKLNIILAVVVPLLITLGSYSADQAEKTPTKGTTKRNVSVEVKEIAWPSTPWERFATFKKAPQGQFAAWWVKSYELGQEKFIQAKDSSWLELLVLFNNGSQEDQEIKADDLKIEYAGQQVSPWEVLQAGAAYDYDSLAEKFALSLPKSHKVIRLRQEGMSCTLQPGEQTWAIFIYQLPRDLQNAQVALGEDLKIKIK